MIWQPQHDLAALVLLVYMSQSGAYVCFHVFAVKKRDRIAQLVLERIFTPAVLEVEVSCELSLYMHYMRGWIHVAMSEK